MKQNEYAGRRGLREGGRVGVGVGFGWRQKGVAGAGGRGRVCWRQKGVAGGWEHLSRHVGGSAFSLQLEQALGDDLGALLPGHQLLQGPQDLHKHLTPQSEADEPSLRLHACNPACHSHAQLLELHNSA